MSPKKEQDEWIFDTVKAPTVVVPNQTQKRRRVSVTPSGVTIHPDEAVRQLNLKGTSVKSRSSQYSTVRKVSQTKQSSHSENISPASLASVPRQPLGPDLSFGNSGSTTRQFRRVSDNSPAITPEGSFASRDENHSMWPDATTKEAQLGRKAYTVVIDAAFQETHAQTSSQLKREALARVASAWAALDVLDPEGEYQLLRSMASKLQRYALTRVVVDMTRC